MSLLINYGIRASAGVKTEAPTITLVTQRQTQIVVRVTNNDQDAVIFTTISYGSSTFISTDTINANGGTRDFTITGLAINSAVSFIANVDSGKGLSKNSNTLNTSTLDQVAPTISNITATGNSITFRVKNNNLESSVIRASLDSDPIISSNPNVTLAAGATSGDLTFTGLQEFTTYSLRAAAFITDISGPVETTSVTTPELILYTAATGGTTTTYTSGGKRYRTHTFTSSENFVVTSVGNGDRNQVDYLIIAGGGGGNYYAGGGAGGYRNTVGTRPGGTALEEKIGLLQQTYPIIVGAGGTGLINSQKGGNSSAFEIVSTGGGGARVHLNTSVRNGGSGAGGNPFFSSLVAPRAGGTGISGQGRNGGSGGVQYEQSATGNNEFERRNAGAGAGGAGGTGSNASVQTFSQTPGNGGAGLTNNIRNGTNVARAGGGAGSADLTIWRNNFGDTPIYQRQPQLSHGTSSAGGGRANGNGTVNTGGGGGGGNGGAGAFVGGTDIDSAVSGGGGSGGSGIVIIRYEIAP
jgi:hypothetical protein